MTSRRTFLSVALATSAVPWSQRSGAAGGAAPKVHRIGVIDSEPEAHVALWNEFVEELDRRGYKVGRNLSFDRRFVRARDPAQHAKAAAELVAAKVDVLYAARGTESALAAKRATTSIPIVFFSSADPVGTGLVSNLARPGGNITGGSATSAALAAKNVELLVQILGRQPLRVAQIQPRGTRSQAWFPGVSASVLEASRRLGASYDYIEIDDVAELDPLLKRLARDRFDAVTFESMTTVGSGSEWSRIANQLVDLRMASIGDPSDGFLFSYEPDWLELSRIAAQNVDRILRGASPGQLPVQQPTIFELAINLKTAMAIGLRIPEAVVLRADRVIR